ncbi:MAG TPA: NAD(P)/FAD-dependent oxidoreductase [Candidatus Polarisedimenticolia bacterium]|nr:NAD(P)/FAD-dependent oxidoreductase [Candidatus Polarisedimenticolia bacterium]
MSGRRTTRRIAIIGGGPAGAQCAARLAEGGAAVTVYEARSHFEKPCGGGIPDRGFELYPFLAHPALPARRLSTCLILSPAGRRATIPLAQPLHVVNRADLHDFMLRRAQRCGALLLRRRVVSFRREHRGWLLHTAGGEGAATEQGPYDFLVAADGAAGASRRRLIGALPAGELTQGIGYYLPGVVEDQITLRFYHGLNGYLWVFPRLDHSSVGICGPLGSIPAADLRALLEGFITERYGAASLQRARRYAALIPAAASEPSASTVQGDGWALVGDSGRFVDPLTREGIFHAMQAADRLADALLADRPADYAASWGRTGGEELAWAARHADQFFAPRFIEMMIALCAASPAVARVMSDLIAGRQPYRSLKRRLLLCLPAVVRDVALRRLTGRRLPGTSRFRLSRGS